MKQHITVEQLNKLTPEEKEKLREWWKPQDNDLIYGEDIYEGQCVLGSIDEEYGHCFKGKRYGSLKDLSLRWKFCPAYPLFSVGQMIEFLNDYTNQNWSIRIHGKISDLDYPIFKHGPDDYEDMELCDALWNAVVEVLRNEKNEP